MSFAFWDILHAFCRLLNFSNSFLFKEYFQSGKQCVSNSGRIQPPQQCLPLAVILPFEGCPLGAATVGEFEDRLPLEDGTVGEFEGRMTVRGRHCWGV